MKPNAQLAEKALQVGQKTIKVNIEREEIKLSTDDPVKLDSISIESDSSNEDLVDLSVIICQEHVWYIDSENTSSSSDNFTLLWGREKSKTISIYSSADDLYKYLSGLVKLPLQVDDGNQPSSWIVTIYCNEENKTLGIYEDIMYTQITVIPRNTLQGRRIEK